MEIKSISTFEEYVIDQFGKIPEDSNDMIDLGHEYAVLFAKYHRKHQIKAIIGYINDKYPNLLNDYMIHKEDLENAYSEDNIK